MPIRSGTRHRPVEALQASSSISGGTIRLRDVGATADFPGTGLALLNSSREDVTGAVRSPGLRPAEPMTDLGG